MQVPTVCRKSTWHPQACRSLLTSILILFLASPAGATLPEIPRGVAVLNTVGDKALRTGILGNPDIAMISIDDDWSNIQPDAATFNFQYLDNTLGTISQYPDKSVLLRLRTMGNSQTNGGDIPDWVYTLMGEDPGSLVADPGVTYSFLDADGVTQRCIPVFWNPVYLAKKKILIAMAGAHFASNPAIKIVGLAYANAVTDDWNVPHDNTSPPPTEVDLWLEAPPDGAGYTTQKIIDAAIHQADSPIFTDGVVSRPGTTLNSASAVFTQADVGHQILGSGFANGTTISAWVSPTQVTLSRRARRNANSFMIVGRRDGLIDVAMAAFPNQYITTAVNSNGPDLDSSCLDPGICLAETVNQMAQIAYPGRYIVQRNNVSAIIPLADQASDAWVVLVDAASIGMPVAGQALGVCWSNQTSSYRMNGGNNCDHDNPDCVPGPDGLCTGNCALSYGDILQRSADHIASYGATYYEIYPPDASNLQDTVTYIHCLLDPTAPNCNPRVLIKERRH